MVYRSLHGLAPDYLSSRFEKREAIYCLRDSDNRRVASQFFLVSPRDPFVCPVPSFSEMKEIG